MAVVLLGEHDQGEGPEPGREQDEDHAGVLGQVGLQQAVVGGDHGLGEEVGRLDRLRAPHEARCSHGVAHLERDVTHRARVVTRRRVVGQHVLLIYGLGQTGPELVELLGVRGGDQLATRPVHHVLESAGVEAIAVESYCVHGRPDVAQGPHGVARGGQGGEAPAAGDDDHGGLGIGVGVGVQHAGGALDPVPQHALAVGLELVDALQHPLAVSGEGTKGHEPIGEGDDPHRDVLGQALHDGGDAVADVRHDGVHGLGGVDGDDHRPLPSGVGQRHDIAHEVTLDPVVGDDRIRHIGLVAAVGEGHAHDVAAGGVDPADGEERCRGLLVGGPGQAGHDQDEAGEQHRQGDADQLHRAEPIIW